MDALDKLFADVHLIQQGRQSFVKQVRRDFAADSHYVVKAHGYTYILTKSLDPKYKYRVTTFDSDMEPWGHTEFSNFTDASVRMYDELPHKTKLLFGKAARLQGEKRTTKRKRF